MSLTVGQEFSHYKVLGPLGQGGMGVVYRARDTRLDRDVAIKVVPGDWAEDSQLLQRLEREAKVLASLNHPYIAQIHAVETLDSSSLLVLELVEGEELATRIGRGALPVDEAVTLCAQIAEGLESAHEAGVVHRDLKPANVRVTPQGVAKVLDFGLAKPQHGNVDAKSMTSLTGEGVLVGTPAYMAPEAVRGQPVDRRGDVWAFGCILYECLTGERPFQADSLADLMGAILEREPDLAKLPANTPPLVRRLVTRCLDKNPRTRLQDMGEARIALTGGRGDEAIHAASVQVTRTSLTWPIVAVVGAVLLTLFSVQTFGPDQEQPNPLDRAISWDQLNLPGSEFDVDISPSGETIVFGSNRDGVLDLWRSSIRGEDLENMTQGEVLVIDEPVRNMGLKGNLPWTLEGRLAVAFTMSAPGATPEIAVGKLVVEPDWSRDGSWVVYHTNEPGDPTYVHRSGEARGEPIERGVAGEHLHYPVWSFDEKWIFFTRGNAANWQMDLWRMRVDGTDPQQLTTRQLQVAFPTPIDERTVLFIGHDEDGSGPWLWALDLPTLGTRRVTVGLGQYTSVAASGDGHTVVATAANPKAELWQVPIRGAEEGIAREDDASRLPGVPSLRALAPRYADGKLFYLSSRGGGDGLYMVRDGKPRELRPDQQEPLVFLPSISPDGETVALIRREGARMVLSLLGVEDRAIRDLDSAIDARGGSCWDPTATWIVIVGIGPDGPGLFRFSAAEGTWEPLLKGVAVDPIWSPTEDLIVYGAHRGGPWNTLKGMRPDGTEVELPGEDVVLRGAEQFRFLPDGSGVVFLSYFQGSRYAQDFWLWDRETGETRQLTELDMSGYIRTFDISPDGAHIVFDRTEPNSDVEVIRLGDRDP